VLYALALVFVGIPVSAAEPKPNIVWIVCEDISPFLGCYGNRELKTPNLDRLAQEGVRFDRAYTVAGVCAPSRAALITGMYPTAIGAHHMRTWADAGFRARLAEEVRKNMPKDIPPYSAVPQPEVRAFPEYLRKAGYFTSNNRKTDYQFVAPVTVWDDIGPTASYRNRPEGVPFFSVFNFMVTHESLLALGKDPITVDPKTVTVPPIYPDTPGVRAGIARMYTNIEVMDRQVAELVQHLKDDGVYDDAVIFFYSDHGGSLPWMKREVLERGTRIPLIIRLPGGKNGGSVNADLVSGVDFAPTVLSLAGVPVPKHMHGQPFLGKQKAKEPRKYVFAARDRMDTEYDRVRMVRDGRYRYLFNYFPDRPYYQNITYRLQIPMMKEILKARDGGTLSMVQAAWFMSKPVEELYDVEHDPWELSNLAGDPKLAQKRQELRSALSDWAKRYGDLGGIPEKEMLRRWWGSKDEPPATATPTFVVAHGGVTIACETEAASIGYHVTRPDDPAPAQRRMRTWDGDLYFGAAKDGATRPAQPVWKLYNGEVIALNKGETLHVNAMRIGYRPALIDYMDGRSVVPSSPKK
jgi:arylsulfatase A-like enzyme